MEAYLVFAVTILKNTLNYKAIESLKLKLLQFKT